MRYTKKTAVVDAEYNRLLEASAVATAGQEAAQDAGLDEALEVLKAQPYVDGQRVVYTHAEVEVVKSGSEDVIEEDGEIQVLLPPITQELPVTQENTHAKGNDKPEEILSYCDKDEVYKVFNFRAEQFVETIDLEPEDGQSAQEDVEEVAGENNRKICLPSEGG